MVRTKPKKKSPAQRSRRRPPRRGPATRTTEAALAAFAHDIRTSLTGILALGELLASSNLGERERRWASGIKTGAEHLAALTTLAIDAVKAGFETYVVEDASRGIDTMGSLAAALRSMDAAGVKRIRSGEIAGT